MLSLGQNPVRRLRRTRRFFAATVLMLLAAISAVLTPSAMASAPSEYELKAVFLLNFARFIQWPASVLSPGNEPFTIGIIGDDPFGPFLDSLIEGETVDGHPLIVKRYVRNEVNVKCQILYISRSEAAHLPALLNRLSGQAILTVSDVDRFASLGGIIGLMVDQGKVRVQINMQNAKNAQLAISAKLLRLAVFVHSEARSILPAPSQNLYCDASWLLAKVTFINRVELPDTQLTVITKTLRSSGIIGRTTSPYDLAQ